LDCRANGDPAPSISWRKVNGNLPSGGRTEIREGTLTIRRAEKEDSGVYICSASSGVFKIEAATQVTVAGEPTRFRFDMYDVDLCDYD
jgi:hypothetical protein